MRGPPPRKLIKHFERVGGCRLLTFSCYQHRPLLADEERLELLSRAIDHTTERHGHRLAAFVFMPDHVHLVVWPTLEASPVDRLLFAIKRPFSYRVKQQLIVRRDPLLKRLTVRQRPGVVTFRFWQEGPGHDRNLIERDTTQAAIDYLHRYPARRGLCERAIEWRWSSARWYEDPTHVDPKLSRLTALPPETFDSGGTAY